MNSLLIDAYLEISLRLYPGPILSVCVRLSIADIPKTF